MLGDIEKSFGEKFQFQPFGQFSTFQLFVAVLEDFEEYSAVGVRGNVGERLPFWIRGGSLLEILNYLRQSKVIDSEGKSLERNITSSSGFNGTIILILDLFNFQNCLGFVDDFCADMATGIVVILVLMNDGVEMKIALLGPLHQLVDNIGRLLW